jgi:hypothetical protein
MAYEEQETKEFLEDVMDQLDEARDVALLRSARYQQVLRQYHSRQVRGRAFNIEDLVLCLVQSNKDHTTYPCHGKGRTSSQKYSDRAPTNSRPSMAKSSPMHGILNSYVAFTLRFFQVVYILM